MVRQILVGIGCGNEHYGAMDTPIRPGDVVIVTTASGEQVRMRALSGPSKGRDFTVLWVTTEVEFRKAEEGDGEPEAIPWPLTALHPA